MNIFNEKPSVEETMAIRLASGADPVHEHIVNQGLDHSICVMVARDDQSNIVGMGRIIGDGGCYYQIVDMMVRPEFHGKGIEEQILTRLLDYLNANASMEATVMVMSDVGSIKLYQTSGFKLVYPDYYGMVRMVGQS
ncbi:GNAT family N-acetyltransferase [Paenibacillus chibensis]|uniref:GNAT family N-acetyltransferase n=1 Tax=Paenibacillus chibensis TaxID=59846 RepID=UPI0013E316A0|nr:GNAT family N-acetyltransferase [Paenibacillus chibensis]MEC0370281.1 GNAT family N-acetyltransferase [Paenibacillus chibensis]